MDSTLAKYNVSCYNSCITRESYPSFVQYYSTKNMNKQVVEYRNVREKVHRGVDTLANPVRGTISPKGRNVIFQNEQGEYVPTNDGATIAKSIWVEDPVENAIISIMKSGSLKTNSEAGDGTSTSILLEQVLIKEGFKLIDGGWNPMDVKRAYDEMSETILGKLKKRAVPVKTDDEIRSIARISANGDEQIAENVLKVVKVVGEDGMVFLDHNNKPETELEEENGFKIDAGLFAPELRNNPRTLSAAYTNVPVLITDKRLYYPEEAETILKTVLLAGHKSVVIVARDFTGQCINTFIANHAQGVCNVLMVKEPRVSDKDTDALADLAVYLGGKVVSEKTGSLVDNISIDDFVICEKAFADGLKTLIVSKKKKNKELTTRVAALKKELAKNKNDESLKKRIASLTNGIMTIKVGGNTPGEIVERSYRYEDAVHATRAAVKDGYLYGGGLTLLNIYEELRFPSSDLETVFRKFCEANVRQIAENCGEHPDSIVNFVRAANQQHGNKTWKHGYNAMTGDIEDLSVSGVLDPYKVTEMAVRNSISVAGQIISSDYFVLEDMKDDKKDKND